MHPDRSALVGTGAAGVDVLAALAEVRRAIASLRQTLLKAPPASTPRAAAHELACETGNLERLAASATLSYARAAGKEAVPLLAAASGTTPGTARRKLEVARRASDYPPLADALGRGDLSVDQTAVLAPLAAIDPPAAGALIEAAQKLSVTELRAETARLIHQHRGERTAVRDERVLHERRYCRAWVEPSGSIRLDARFGRRDGVAVLSALRQEHDRLWRSRAARTKDASDSATPTPDQVRADALFRLVTGSGTRRGLGAPELLVRVDADALRRGEVARGEVCEIAGVGPVSVDTARGLLGHALGPSSSRPEPTSSRSPGRRGSSRRKSGMRCCCAIASASCLVAGPPRISRSTTGHATSHGTA